MKRGTLTFGQLLSLSRIAPATLMDSLLVLSLHSLVRHFESDVNGKLTETYTIDLEAVENRLRGATFAEFASQQWPGMDRVIDELFCEGMLQQDRLCAVLADELWHNAQMGHALSKTSSSSKKGKGKQRLVSSKDEAEREAAQMFVKAVQKGYVGIITQHSQLSEQSIIDNARSDITKARKDGSILTAKAKREIEEELEEYLDEWRTAERLRARGQDPDKDAARHRRRKRRDADSDESDGWLSDLDSFAANKSPLPQGKWYRINPEGFHLHMRSRVRSFLPPCPHLMAKAHSQSQIMRKFAEQMFTPAIGIFFGLFLDFAESQQSISLADEESQPITNSSVLNAFSARYNEDQVLKDCWALGAHHDDDNDDVKWHKPRRVQEALDEALSCLARTDDTRLWIDETMHRRGVHPRAFLRNASAAGDGKGSAGGKWVVLFGNVGRRIKRLIIENLIQDQLGIEGVRCFRVLLERGFLEEKHVARLAFLSVKDAREVIGRLREHGWITLQEVSRTSDRAASRTIFLWGVAYDSVVEKAVAHHYKALANAESQKKYQVELRRTVVDKREKWRRDRKSVSMTSAEHEACRELDEALETLTVAQQRIDRDLFVLRYFHAEKGNIVRS